MTGCRVLWSRVPLDELEPWLTDAFASQALLDFEPYVAFDPTQTRVVQAWRGVKPGSIELPTVSSWTPSRIEALQWTGEGGYVVHRVIETANVIAAVVHEETGTFELVVHAPA